MRGLGLCVREVACARRAVELTLPGKVVVHVEHSFLSLLLLFHKLVLNLVHVFSPDVNVSMEVVVEVRRCVHVFVPKCFSSRICC